MKRVARRVALNLSESKRFATLNVAFPTSSNGNATQWYVRNVFSGSLGQGTGSFSIIGSEIQTPLLKVKFTGRVNFGALNADNPDNMATVTLNMFLIATNDQIGNTTDTPTQYGLSPFSGLNWFYSNDGHKPTFNGNNVKVLKSWSRRVHPEVIAGTTARGIKIVRGNLRYRWRRKLTFEDTAGIPASGGPTSANVLKGWNYYLIAGYGLSSFLSTSLTAAPSMQMDSFLYFKDP